MFNEFKKFILRGNVVDLAVGVIIGSAFNSVVQALVKMFTDLLPRGGGFGNTSFHVLGRTVIYGTFINALISFLLVATVVFFLVVQPINRLSDLAFRSKKTDEPSTKKCPYCLGKIPKAATRCQFCTSKLEAKTDS